MKPTILTIDNIHKSFGPTLALRGVSFEMSQGQIVALLGPSGCGKSTLLNIIAGLELPDRGDVRWNGASLAGVPPHQRGFGLMFQDYALFPHLDVGANVAFGLKMAKLNREVITNRVKEVLNLVGLAGFGSRDVNTLSGGEQQRVALARALALEPKLLMLDEPLGSLDRSLRERLMIELSDILRQTQQTALYVTHDQEEAFAIASQIVVMNLGQVAQIGTPQTIYREPASTFLARFLGLNNLLPGEVRIDDGKKMVHTPIGAFPISGDYTGEITVLLRPEMMKLNQKRGLQFTGIVVDRSFRGSMCRAIVDVDGVQLNVEIPCSQGDVPSPGSLIHLGFDPSEAIQVLA
jgi:ABC-type Fe3+/spermidine/putrescine transport system ATPase subunit